MTTHHHIQESDDRKRGGDRRFAGAPVFFVTPLARCVWIRGLAFLMLGLGWVGLGCDHGPVETESVVEEQEKFSLKADSPVWMDGDPVRLAMVDIADQFPSGTVEELFSEGMVTETAQWEDVALSGRVRDALLTGIKFKKKKFKNGTFRVWRYRVNVNLPRLNLAGVRIPFRMMTGAEIEFARVFESEWEADTAAPLTLYDLPFDAASALALPVGTVVTIPVKLRAAIDVNGVFLTRAANKTHELHDHLSTSAVGRLSAIRQGTLMAEGQFQIQVIRLEGDKVRVRLFDGSKKEFSFGGMFNGYASTSYTFLPSSILDRARAIRRRAARLQNLKKTILSPKTIGERTEELYERVSPPMQLLMAYFNQATGGNGNTDWVRELANSIEDGAQTVLYPGGASLEELESHIKNRVQSMVDVVEIPWKNRIEPTMAKMEALSNRVYKLTGSVTLSKSFSKRVSTLADYTFDLNDPDAVLALERAISGRTALIGFFEGQNESDPTDALYADLTLAEELATEDEGSAYPRVRREAVALGDMTEERFSARISALWMSTEWGSSNQKNEFSLTDSDGHTRHWEGRAWERMHSSSWIGGSKSETFASGAFVDDWSSANLDGGYWFTWRRSYPDFAPWPQRDALAEALNLLGPAGMDAGIHTLYGGEQPGKVHAELDVVFSKSALDVLFDADMTSDALLWGVLGEVAMTFDNSFGLPYWASPFRPDGLELIPGASEACEEVAKAFGGGYCFFFAEEFLPTLRLAQESEDPSEQLAFFERYYKFGGWFGNPIGSRLLVRYVASVLHELGMSADMTIRFQIRNEADSSEIGSPQLQYGSDEALARLKMMTPVGMN